MMCILNFAVYTSVGLETGYSNAHLESTSLAVIIFLKTPFGGILGNPSFLFMSNIPLPDVD